MAESESGGASGLTRRRRCSCTKDDFLPEESFQSWANYVSALKQTPARLADRFRTRSTVEAELEVKTSSEHELKKTLMWWEPDVVRHGRRHRRRDFRPHRERGESGCGPRRRAVVRHFGRQYPPRVRHRQRRRGPFLDVLLRHILQPQARKLPHPRPRLERQLQPPRPHRRRLHHCHRPNRRPQHQRLVPSQLHRLRRPPHHHRLHHRRGPHQGRPQKLQTLRPVRGPRHIQSLRYPILLLRRLRRGLHNGRGD
ncbi:cationic amino acid transporter 1 [Phtheirospermum japonicum]|uniref:Cationic amino acid transporter 1 n=1 Tax=Phtheirospermum japonicum TaxID=374723 RepID=A0A830BGP3_9LAMI|nr:cationic amino acid transporter 1 [Phtheirospermum japonicum]